MTEQTKKIIFFDLETSGLGLSPFGGPLPPSSLSGHNDTDQILSAYFIVTDDQGEILERMNVILGTRGDIVPKADALAVTGMQVHGRTGLSEAQAAAKIRALFVRHGGINAIVAGHNSEVFDIPRLRSLLARNGVDPAVVPRASVDTRTEATRAWVAAVKPTSGQTLQSGTEADSMTLAAACKRHGVPFSKDEAHDARYDTESTLRLWKALGRPQSSRDKIFDSPYEIEKKAGKTIKLNVVEFGAFKEKQLTVVGCGIWSVATEMGPKHLTDTFLLNDRLISPQFGDTLQRYVKAKATLAKTDGPAADQAASDFEATRGELEGMLGKDGVLVKRGFNSAAQFYEGEDTVSDSTLFDRRTIDGLDPARELAQILMDTVLMETELKVKQAAQDLYDRYENQFRDLLPLSNGLEVVMTTLNPVTPLGDNAVLVVPDLARRLAPLSPIDRRRFMLAILTDQGLGWAGNLLEMTEKYGARNNIPGYESTRLALLEGQLPSSATIKMAKWSIDELFPKAGEQKALKATGLLSILATTDGSTIKLILKQKDGTDSIFLISYPDVQPKRSGSSEGLSLQANATVAYISEQIQALPIDINKAGADVLARQISQKALVPADRSFGSYKQTLTARLAHEQAKHRDEQNQPLIDALKITSAVLGPTPEHLANNMVAVPFMTDDEHTAIFGEPPPEGFPSEDESMLATYDDLRSDFLDATIRKALATNDEHPIHTGDDVSQAVSMSAGVPQGFVRLTSFTCKICLRTVKSRTSVEGIGPKCAKKLRHFIENPMVVSSPGIQERTIGDIESSFKTQGDARRYPIMLVRTATETFVADVVEKLEDGSLLMINLTRLASTAGTKKQYTKISPTATKVTAAFVGDLGIVVGAPDIKVIKVFGED